MVGPFDSDGHILYCPAWADRWEAHHGRTELDDLTVRYLDDMRTPERRAMSHCPRCRLTSVPEEMAAEFDAHGHRGCPTWADLWERHYGRDSLDAGTVRNLDEMRTEGHRAATRCTECRLNADPEARAAVAQWEPR